MRTSEIIMSKGCVARSWSALSPESAVVVWKFWLSRKDSMRLRWPGSSSTIRSLGLGGAGTDEGSGGGELDVRDAEDRAAGFVGETFDFPSMSEDDLLHHGEAESSSLLMGGEIGLEDFVAMFGRDAGAVVANFDGDGV